MIKFQTSYQTRSWTQREKRGHSNMPRCQERPSHDLTNSQHFPPSPDCARLVNQRNLSTFHFSIWDHNLIKTLTLWTRWMNVAQMITKINNNYESMSAQSLWCHRILSLALDLPWANSWVYSQLAFLLQWLEREPNILNDSVDPKAIKNKIQQ